MRLGGHTGWGYGRRWNRAQSHRRIKDGIMDGIMEGLRVDRLPLPLI